MTETSSLETITLDKITEDPNNVRTHYTDIPALAKSIAEVGLIEPLQVRAYDIGLDTEHYVVIDGNRRRRALVHNANGDAATTGVQCYVTRADNTKDSTEDTLTQLVTGLTKVNLDPVDMAEGIARAMGLGMSLKELALATGLKQPLVKARLNLLNLPKTKRAAIIEDIGLDNASALGAAIAKHPSFKVTKDQYDRWPHGETVEKWAAAEEASREAELLRDKVMTAGGEAYVLRSSPGQTVKQQANDVLPSGYIECIAESGHGHAIDYNREVRVSGDTMRKLRRTSQLIVVFVPSYGWTQGGWKGQVEKHEFVPKADIPKEARARIDKSTAALQGDSDKKRIAEQKARRARYAQQVAEAGPNLNASQRNRLVELATASVLARVMEPDTKKVAAMVPGFTPSVPKDGKHAYGALKIELGQYARTSTKARDNVLLAALTVGVPADTVIKFLNEVCPEPQL
jgi:hypothetical protein